VYYDDVIPEVTDCVDNPAYTVMKNKDAV